MRSRISTSCSTETTWSRVEVSSRTPWFIVHGIVPAGRTPGDVARSVGHWAQVRSAGWSGEAVRRASSSLVAEELLQARPK